MPAGHLVTATFMLPVIEVMFSVSPNRTRSDKPNKTLVSLIWLRIRANIEHNLHESSPRVCISHHTSGQAERHLRSWAHGGWGEMWRALSNADRPIEILAGSSRWDCLTDIWIWWNFVSKHFQFFVYRLFYGAKSVPAKMSLSLQSPHQNVFKK